MTCVGYKKRSADMEWMDNVNGLQHIGIPASDMKETEEFYKSLDLSRCLGQITEGFRWCF